MRVLALDVSKGKSYVVVYDKEVCIEGFEIEHNLEGLNHLKHTLDGFKTEVVFEATGVHSLPIEAFLQSEGIAFCRMNPLLAKMHTQALRSNKTDIVDAHKLAQSHYRFDRKIVPPQAVLYSELKDISSLYDEFK